LTPLGEIALTLPNDSPVVATLVAFLEDAIGNRIHVNFTQWLVRDESGSPRVETLDEQTLVLRFRPDEFTESQFNEPEELDPLIESKHYGRGHGVVKYRLRLPDGLPLESLESVVLLCEVAAKAGREKVDWAERVKPQDYPQTDAKKFPTTAHVDINGVEVAAWHLPDDPADARGVLSHWRGVERGSYGSLQVAETSDTSNVVAIANRLREMQQLVIRFSVPENASHRGGFAIYGENMGCYPVDPTVILKFTKPFSIRE
jgi:hypothetical protein